MWLTVRLFEQSVTTSRLQKAIQNLLLSTAIVCVVPRIRPQTTDFASLLRCKDLFDLIASGFTGPAPCKPDVDSVEAVFAAVLPGFNFDVKRRRLKKEVIKKSLTCFGAGSLLTRLLRGLCLAHLVLHETWPTELLRDHLIVLIGPICADDLLLIVRLLLSLIKLLVGRQIAILARIVNRVILTRRCEPVLTCVGPASGFRAVTAAGLGGAVVVRRDHMLSSRL